VIADGQKFWIRWTDVDTAGSDDANAIDDFSLTVTTSNISIDPKASGTASPNSVNPGQQTTLSGTITPGQNPTSASFAVSCDLSVIGGSAAQSLPVTGSTFTLPATVSAGTEPGSYTLPCSVTDDQQR